MYNAQEFLSNRAGSKFRSIDGQIVETLLEFIGRPENIYRMILANDEYKRPPLAGIVQRLEEELTYNFEHSPQLRQLVGALVSYVLAPFGYKADSPGRKLYEACWFKTASRYKKQVEPKSRLSTSFSIESA